jgi:hypothetical protein
MQLTTKPDRGTDETSFTVQHIQKGYHAYLSLTDNFSYHEMSSQQQLKGFNFVVTELCC